jgi:hypothetical protein
MASKFTNLALTWFDNTDNYVTSTVITADLVGSGVFTDTGSGEVNEFEFSLSAKGGKYLNTGTILQEHDRFCITVDDLDGNSYGPRYFELTDIIPTQSKDEGSTVLVKCLGIEYHTQVINFAKREWFQNAFRICRIIGDSYGDPTIGNKGSAQPVIDKHDEVYSTVTKTGNGLPLYTNNHYEFGLAEDNHYNRWMDLVDGLGGAVTSGGVGDFFELGWDTPSVNQIDLALCVSGDRSRLASDDANHVTIKNTTLINVSEQEGGISNPTGTKILAWGSPGHGSLPTGLSKYRGGELEFTFRPEWVTAIPYVEGAKVLVAGKHYIATATHTGNNSGVFATDLGNSYWTQIDMGDEFGDDTQYSEWTDDKANLWANAGCAPRDVTTITSPTDDWVTSTPYAIGDLVIDTSIFYVAVTKHTSGTLATDVTNGKMEVVEHPLTGAGAGFFDSNLIIRDHQAGRTWVTEIVGDTDYSGGGSDAVQDLAYTHNGNNLHPLGYRALNVSNTFLSGTDKNGRSFTDAVIEWREVRGANKDTSGEWFVHFLPDSTTDRYQVAVIDRKELWEWNDSTSHWEEITLTGGVFQNDDCFHQYKSIYNVAGVDPRPIETDSTKYPEITKAGGIFAKNNYSAIEVVYTFGKINQAPKTGADFKKGAWLNFTFPFPINSLNGITENVGDIYGGGQNEANPTHPSYLDTENLSWTSQGLLGFNHDSSEDLGAIQSISFHNRIGIYDLLSNPLDGKALVRCTMYDGKDNVVTQDYEADFTNGRTWQEINLPITGFTIYRGREPKSYELRGLSIVGFEVPLKELDIQDVFEFQNIKHISLQIQNFYDDDGRYNPEKDMTALSNTGLFTSIGGTIRFAVDSWHFKKPLLVSTGKQAGMNIEPTFLQRPNIISYNQLLNDAKSQLELERFKHKEFNFQTSGHSLFDIRFGDTFFLENADLVVDTDDPTTTPVDESAKKKVKLVAKRIEYHITKPRVGPGGITRSIKGVKRFI